MPPPPERRWPAVLAGYVVLVGLVGLAGTPAYLYVEPAAKAAVVRLLAAVILGVGLIHLLRVVRAWIDEQPPSAFERALARPRAEPHLAPVFVRLRDEIRLSTQSQGYFAHVLWPRINALVVGRFGGPPETGPAKPPGRRLLRRGPSLATLRDLIAEIEERR